MVSKFLDKGVSNNWTNDTYDWSKEIVLVTGGSDGIGAQVVNLLAERGIKVVVLDIQPLKYVGKFSRGSPSFFVWECSPVNQPLNLLQQLVPMFTTSIATWQILHPSDTLRAALHNTLDIQLFSSTMPDLHGVNLSSRLPRRISTSPSRSTPSPITSWRKPSSQP
jgi:hypothetical protein